MSDGFVRVCAAADVSSEEALGVTLGDLDVAIARNGDEFFAIQDLCSHAAVQLSEGEVEARKLVVRGFFAELLAKIPVLDLRERLGNAIEARLAEVGA